MSMAMIGSAIIVGGATYLSSKEQADAAGKAADAQAGGADAATRAQLEMYYRARKDLAPWRIEGRNALYGLMDQMKAGPGAFDPAQEPGYQFGFNEFIEKPYLAGAGAKGKLFSGQTGKDLTRYASDYAETKYDNWLSRYYDKLKPWQSMAGVGQTSATQTGANALATGQLIGNNALSAGNARATGYINRGNVNAAGIYGIGNALGKGWNALSSGWGAGPGSNTGYLPPAGYYGYDLD